MSETSEPAPAKQPPNKQQLLFRTLWILFFTVVAIRGVHELRRISWVHENLMLLTGLVLIYVPIMVLWLRKERMDFFENSFGQLARSLFWFAVAAAIIFPIIEIANRYYQELFRHYRYVGGNYQDMARFAFFQLVIIAVPEEFFYRGFIQEQLNRVWGKPYSFLGARIGLSLLVTSALFALSHSLITFQWWHFSIFFPSLVFGWLKEKTGAITASALFHASCNLYSYWVGLNYRPM